MKYNVDSNIDCQIIPLLRLQKKKHIHVIEQNHVNIFD